MRQLELFPALPVPGRPLRMKEEDTLESNTYAKQIRITRIGDNAFEFEELNAGPENLKQYLSLSIGRSVIIQWEYETAEEGE